MAKSKKNGRKSNENKKRNYWSYVGENNKFVPKGYKGKVYKYVDGQKIFVGYSVPQQRTSRGKNQFVEKIKSESTNRPFSAGGNKTVFVKDLPNWQDRQEVQKPAKLKSTDDHFEFSYAVQKKWGIDREQQKKIWETLRQANQIGAEYKELTDSVYNAKFSYNLEAAESFSQLERRIQAAQRVISGEYFETIATKYKTEFKEAFSNVIDRSTMVMRAKSGYISVSEEEYKKALQEAYPTLNDKQIRELMQEGTPVGNIRNITDVVFEDIDELSDAGFYQLLRKTGNESLAYALDSIINTYGYEAIINELLYVGNLTRELR